MPQKVCERGLLSCDRKRTENKCLRFSGISKEIQMSSHDKYLIQMLFEHFMVPLSCKLTGNFYCKMKIRTGSVLLQIDDRVN